MIRKTRKLKREWLEGFSNYSRTLNVGCGNSKYLDLFPNQVTLDMSRRYSPDHCMRAESMVFVEEFEQVLLLDVLEHVDNPVLVVRNCYRALKPGGVLLCTSPFLYPEHQVPDYRRYTCQGLCDIFSNVGFTVYSLYNIMALSTLFHKKQFELRREKKYMLSFIFLIMMFAVNMLDKYCYKTIICLEVRK